MAAEEKKVDGLIYSDNLMHSKKCYIAKAIQENSEE